MRCRGSFQIHQDNNYHHNQRIDYLAVQCTPQFLTSLWEQTKDSGEILRTAVKERLEQSNRICAYFDQNILNTKFSNISLILLLFSGDPI